MNDDKRAMAAAKRKATYEQKKQREQRANLEREQTIRVLRGIRDCQNATPGERLQAIAMLAELQ